MSSNNTVIRASAGSGKTFQLSNRFLRLLFEKESLDTILATTFTRKAAGEILERILLRLAEAELDEKKREELSKFITEGAREIEKAEIDNILLGIVRGLHRLRVSTLDSFFIQIAGNFSLELKIPTGWSVVEEIDNKRLLAEAVKNVFAKYPKQDSINIMHLLSHGEVKRSLAAQAFELADKLLGVYRQAPTDSWTKLPRHKPLSEENLERFLAKFLDAELPAHKGAISAREKAIEAAGREDWGEFLSKGLAPKMLDGTFTYQRKPFPDDLIRALQPLIDHAGAVLVNKLILQTEATGEMLGRINEEFESLKMRDRALRFEDITLKLDSSPLLDNIEWIVHRLDARTKHLLLDEFQDTSPVQWHVLRPFAHSALADPKKNESLGSFFCVGDLKQAIYAWRGGVAEIFDSIEKDISDLRSESLDISFRSAPAVISTVNRLFTRLKTNDALAEQHGAAEGWQEDFEPHETARKNYYGFCSIETAPLADDIPPELAAEWNAERFPQDDADSDEYEKDSGDDAGGDSNQETVNLKYAIKRILELHREAPNANIGVLTYRNRTIGRLIYGLRRKGVEASEEGGNPLTDSAAVQLVLSAMKLADHPGDTVARFHISKSPLAGFFGLSDYKDDSRARNLSLEIRRELLENGYGNTIGKWMEELAPSCDRRELDRLSQLLELAYIYQSKAGIRTDPFIETVRETKLNSASSANIRVMTINQSKGLQFDIVVLPELSRKLIGQAPQLLVGRSEPTGPIERIVRFPNEIVRQFLPEEYLEMFVQHEARCTTESLCLLYVAMTRAIHRLLMIVPPIKPVKKKEGPAVRKTLDGVVRYGLPENGIEDTAYSVLFEEGDPDWYVKESRFARAADENASSGNVKSEIIRSLPHLAPLGKAEELRNIPRLAPSSLDSDSEDELIDLPEIPTGGIRLESDISPMKRGDAMLFGTALHACFEHGLSGFDWLDRGRPDPSKLLEIVGRKTGAHRGAVDPETVVKTFLELCEKPSIREMLSLASYQEPGATAINLNGKIARPIWKVFPERNFIVRGDRVLMKGSIDRLCVLYDGDTPVGADIIDFKSDRLITAENRRHYEGQLQAYRDAVGRLYRLPVEKISARLLFLFG